MNETALEQKCDAEPHISLGYHNDFPILSVKRSVVGENAMINKSKDLSGAGGGGGGGGKRGTEKIRETVLPRRQ